jgi:hypothetical protein
LIVWNAIAAGRGHAKGEQFDAFSSSSGVVARMPRPSSNQLDDVSQIRRISDV